MRSALLYQTHIWSSEIEAQFDQLSSLDGISTWILLDSRTPTADMLVRRYSRCYVFDLERLFRLPYPRIQTPGLKGHAQFPVLQFFLSHPNYDYYWFVEYDVRYTGSWNSLTSSFASFDHDFITTHIRRFSDEPRLWRLFYIITVLSFWISEGTDLSHCRSYATKHILPIALSMAA